MRNFDFEKLDLPNPPADLLIWNDDFSDSIIVDDEHGRTLTYPDNTQRTLTQGVYGRSPACEELSAWVRTNIIADFKNIGMSRNLPPCLGPHMDRTRFYTLQYIIEPGGSAVDTVFYEAECEQLDFDKKNLYMNDYRHLRETSRFRAAKGEWFLINGRAIHSVENLHSMRVLLQVGLMRDPVEKDLLLARRH